MKEEVYLVWARLFVLVRRENMRDGAHSIALQSVVIRSLEAVIEEIEEDTYTTTNPPSRINNKKWASVDLRFPKPL